MRLRLRLPLALGLAAFAVWSAEGRRDDERECEVERTAFFELAVAERDKGPEERQALHRRVRRLIERYERTAPICGGRLREHQAYFYVLDQEYPEIVRILRPYLREYGRRTSPRSRLMLNLQIAYSLTQEGHTLEGARAYFEAAGLADQVPAWFGARALIQAGAAVRGLGEDQASEEYLLSALELINDSLHVDPDLMDLKGAALVSLSMTTDFRLERADSESERDTLAAALERYSGQALAVLRSEGQEAGYRALATNMHALAAALRGEYALARARLRPTAELARRAGVRFPSVPFEIYLTEGRIAELAGDLEGAAAAFERARVEAIRTERSPSEATALERLGRLAEQQARWDEAEAYYTAAIKRREILRERLGLEDWSTSGFATMQAPYRGLVRARLAQGDALGAFTILDQTRARHLRDLRYHHRVRRGLSDEQRRRVDSVSQELSRVRMAHLQAEEAPQRAELRRRTSALQGEIEALTAGPAPSLDSVDVGGLRRALEIQDRTLVSYFIDDERSTAFVVRADTLIAVPIPAPPGRIRALLRTVGAPWRGEAADPAFALGPLHELYRALVGPIRPWVATGAVTVVPDVEIATIPFAMLLTSPGEDFQTAPYLLHDWTLSTELAAGLVTDAPSEHEARGLGVLVMGRSSFPEGSTWNPALGDLDHVPAEVQEVGTYRRSASFLEAEATETRFSRLAPTASVIHLASHAEANPALPLYSRIALSPGDDEDGTLHLYEILDTPITADLVVLSGCSTADGDRRDGEGLMGLQYGMRAAGSAASLATLWAVADDATASLMAGFYDGLADGLGKDEALRRAQLDYLEDHEGLAASPFFWAAPILSGSPAPVPIRGEPRWPLGVAGLALTAGLAWWLRSRHAHV